MEALVLIKTPEVGVKFPIALIGLNKADGLTWKNGSIAILMSDMEDLL